MKLRIVRDGEWRVLAAVCTERGDCDLLDFLEGLDGKLVKDGDRLLRLLQRIADEGTPRNTEVSHKLAGDVWELSSKGTCACCTSATVIASSSAPTLS